MRTPLLIGLGIILSMAHPLVAQGTGRIEGSITDSVAAGPMSGATVRATRMGVEPETTLETTADPLGRFQFDGLVAGRYVVSYSSALLDSLEYGGPAPQVFVVAGRTTRVELAVPSGKTLRAAACPGVALPPGTGVLFGHVLDAESELPLAGAHVLVAWSAIAMEMKERDAIPDEGVARAIANADGLYRLCGVPTGEWLAVQVQHAARAASVLRLSVDDAAGVLVRNLSFSTDGSRPLSVFANREPGDITIPPLAGSASVTGIVRTSLGQPVTGAQVSLISAETWMRTDERGQFSMHGLPAGTHDLEVRHIGYRLARRPVDLRDGRTARQDMQLERMVTLDSVDVIAQRLRYPEFENHRKFAMRGTFLDEVEIERRRPQTSYVSDLLRATPTVFVVGQGSSATAYNAARRCPLLVMVDNAKLNRTLNELAPAQVGSMEVYPDTTNAPPQFLSEARRTKSCGMILIWKKRS